MTQSRHVLRAFFLATTCCGVYIPTYSPVRRPSCTKSRPFSSKKPSGHSSRPTCFSWCWDNPLRLLASKRVDHSVSTQHWISVILRNCVTLKNSGYLESKENILSEGFPPPASAPRSASLPRWTSFRASWGASKPIFCRSNAPGTEHWDTEKIPTPK